MLKGVIPCPVSISKIRCVFPGNPGIGYALHPLWIVNIQFILPTYLASDLTICVSPIWIGATTGGLPLLSHEIWIFCVSPVIITLFQVIGGVHGFLGRSIPML